MVENDSESENEVIQNTISVEYNINNTSNSGIDYAVTIKTNSSVMTWKTSTISFWNVS